MKGLQVQGSRSYYLAVCVLKVSRGHRHHKVLKLSLTLMPVPVEGERPFGPF